MFYNVIKPEMRNKYEHIIGQTYKGVENINNAENGYMEELSGQ